MEVKVVNITEENFDQIPRPVKRSFSCRECFYWIGKKDGKFDLVKQKRKWLTKSLPKQGSAAKMLLWGKRKKPVGYIQFGPIAEFETAQMFYRDCLPLPKGGWCITCVSIPRAYQKKGLAKKLVRNVLRDLKKRGVRQVDAYELSEFWQSFGFQMLLKDEKKVILRKKL